MTFCIIMDIIKLLAIKLSIKIIWFYGEPGHGRGLFDAKSSYGCKLQLRSDIITNDSWFKCAEKMMKFLKDYFKSDDSKEHFLVDAAETAKIRKQKREEFKIDPCRKFHVIWVNSEGSTGKVLFIRDNKIVENSCSKDYEIDHDDNDNELEYDADEYNYEEGFMLNQDTVFELVEPGIIVGMRSPPTAIESFFVAEVMDKGNAENNMIDENGHTIMSAELYLEVCYLQKEAQKKKVCNTNIKRSYTISSFM